MEASGWCHIQVTLHLGKKPLSRRLGGGSTVGLNALREKKNSPPLPEIAQFLLLSLLPSHYMDYAIPVPRPNTRVF